jgi:hypothetical protein
MTDQDNPGGYPPEVYPATRTDITSTLIEDVARAIAQSESPMSDSPLGEQIAHWQIEAAAQAAIASVIAHAMSEKSLYRAMHTRVPGGSTVAAWLPQKDAWTPADTAWELLEIIVTAALSGGE